MDLDSALRLDADSADTAALLDAIRVAQAALRAREEQQQQRIAELEEEEAVAAATASVADASNLMFSIEQLEAMLRRENELRLSLETQEAYAAAELREDTDWMEITAELQRRVVREFGVQPHLEEQALRHFRAAPNLLPQLKPLALYHRFQRSRQGDYAEGDAVPAGLQLVSLPHGHHVSLGLVSAFNSLYAELRDRADIIGVYITEAHAQDEWPISSARYTPDGRPVLLNQPRSTEERLAAAARFVEQYNFQPPMLVDPIENPFDAGFAPWPIRFYILHRGTIRYKAQPRNCSYDLSELRSRLQALMQLEQQEQPAAQFE